MSSRTVVLTLFFLCPVLAFSQSLQLHYDLRHTIDPKYTRKNYPAFYFEYFISFDSAKGFIKPGAFLLKVQTELTGEKHNTGQFYMQVSQTFRFWKPKVFLQLQYNGGLGIAEPGAYGYYLTNAFSLGAAYPFRSKNMKAFFNAYISYKYTDFKKPSHDMISAFFWLLFFSNYSINFSGNLVFLTENRNHGDGLTNNLSGKKFLFYGDPQIWFRLIKGFSAGTRLNLFYHILRENNSFQAYPTIGVRYQF